MGGHDEGSSLVGKVTQESDDRRLAAFVDPGEGLVEEHDASSLGNTTSDEGAFALAARQLADLTIRQVSQLDPFQGLCHGLAILGAWPSGESLLAVATHHDDIAHRHREGPVDVLGLWDISDDAVTTSLGGGVAVDEDPAMFGPNHPHDRLEKGGLA